MDGFPITYPYRMLGSFSLFNPLTTKRIQLLTAGYPVSYGGYAPMAIRVDSKSEYSDRPNIEADASMFVSSVLPQTPVSDSLRMVGKDRRSLLEYRNRTGVLSGSDRERLPSFMPNLKDVQVFSSEFPWTSPYMFQEGLLSQEHRSLTSRQNI